MKKLLLFIPIVLMLNSCGPLSQTSYGDNRWIERTIPPSQVTTSGDVFFEQQLSDGRTFSVGGYLEQDGTYWYNTLMQDLGWRTNSEGGWTQSTVNTPKIKRGYLYINIKKQVAVYFYEGTTFSSFRVTINPE